MAIPNLDNADPLPARHPEPASPVERPKSPWAVDSAGGPSPARRMLTLLQVRMGEREPKIDRYPRAVRLLILITLAALSWAMLAFVLQFVRL